MSTVCIQTAAPVRGHGVAARRTHHPVDSRFATRDGNVNDLPILRGPGRYRASRAALEIVRMSRNRQPALPVGGIERNEVSGMGTTLPRGGNRSVEPASGYDRLVITCNVCCNLPVNHETSSVHLRDAAFSREILKCGSFIREDPYIRCLIGVLAGPCTRSASEDDIGVARGNTTRTGRRPRGHRAGRRPSMGTPNTVTRTVAFRGTSGLPQ